MKKIYAMIAALAMAFALMGVASSAATADNPNYTCKNGEVISDTSGKLHVHVPAGVICTLDHAAVFSLDNEKGAKSVYVYSSTVAHNIHLHGVKRNVVIGEAGCKLDPSAGNNVSVTDSHNVLLCTVHADNNIKVMRNDGRITVRNSQADHSNIMVSNNFKYNKKWFDSHHKHPGAIRVFDNTAKVHISIFHNHGRKVLAHGNTPVAVVK